MNHFSPMSCLFGPSSDLVRVGSRRWFLQTGMTGLAGLSLPKLLQAQEQMKLTGKPTNKKSVILFWLSGGPSHIDMWDPKPNAPSEIRGPFQTIPTSVPGIRFCEHLPLQASMMHKMTVLRGVDCKASNHTPITMQAGNAPGSTNRQWTRRRRLSIDGFDRCALSWPECPRDCHLSWRWLTA